MDPVERARDREAAKTLLGEQPRAEIDLLVARAALEGAGRELDADAERERGRVRRLVSDASRPDDREIGEGEAVLLDRVDELAVPPQQHRELVVLAEGPPAVRGVRR